MKRSVFITIFRCTCTDRKRSPSHLLTEGGKKRQVKKNACNMVWHTQKGQACVCASSVAKLCLTLWNPRVCSPPSNCPWDFPGKNTGASCHFLLLPNLGIQPGSPVLPALTGGFFITEPPEKPSHMYHIQVNKLRQNGGVSQLTIYFCMAWILYKETVFCVI